MCEDMSYYMKRQSSIFFISKAELFAYVLYINANSINFIRITPIQIDSLAKLYIQYIAHTVVHCTLIV